MLVKIENGQPIPYTKSQLKRDNPNVSFPFDISDDMLASYDVHRVQQDEWPEVDPMTHEVEASDVTLIDGVWRITHTVVELSEAEKAERVGFLANENRYKRNNLLSETDFYALSDVTMSSEMQSYRQSLRDITSHANWPNLNDDDWPTKP
jgi:hypothetical protein